MERERGTAAAPVEAEALEAAVAVAVAGEAADEEGAAAEADGATVAGVPFTAGAAAAPFATPFASFFAFLRAARFSADLLLPEPAEAGAAAVAAVVAGAEGAASAPLLVIPIRSLRPLLAGGSKRLSLGEWRGRRAGAERRAEQSSDSEEKSREKVTDQLFSLFLFSSFSNHVTNQTEEKYIY